MRCERDEGKLEARRGGGRGRKRRGGHGGKSRDERTWGHDHNGVDWIGLEGWWRWARARCCVRLGGAYPAMGRYEVHGVEIVLSELVRNMRTSVVIRGRLQATAGGACEGVAFQPERRTRSWRPAPATCGVVIGLPVRRRVRWRCPC